VAVIVPVRNGERTIDSCLESILRTHYPGSLRRIMVVDNASTDHTAQIVRRYPVEYVREPRRGPSAARNRGIQETDEPIIAFTDADCVVGGSWLRELVEAVSEHGVAAAGEILPYPPRTRCERYMAMRRRCWQRVALTLPYPYAVTANVAFRREVFARIGFFDERFTTGEDQDLSWRFLQSGLTLRYAADAIVFHRHRPHLGGFLTQQLAWAHGGSLLRRRYQLPGGLRTEIVEWWRLVRLAGVVVRAGARHATRGGPEMDLYYPLLDLLRRLAWRLMGMYSIVIGAPAAFDRRSAVRLNPAEWRISLEASPPAPFAPAHLMSTPLSIESDKEGNATMPAPVSTLR